MRVDITTIEQADTVYTRVPDRRLRAAPGATRVIRARANGATKFWKRRPQEYRRPYKYGLRECFYITPLNADRFFTTEEEA